MHPQERLLERSPFVALLEKDPGELWENAPNFLAQLELEEEQRRRESLARAAEDARLKAEADEQRRLALKALEGPNTLSSHILAAE